MSNKQPAGPSKRSDKQTTTSAKTKAIVRTSGKLQGRGRPNDDHEHHHLAALGPYARHAIEKSRKLKGTWKSEGGITEWRSFSCVHPDGSRQSLGRVKLPKEYVPRKLGPVRCVPIDKYRAFPEYVRHNIYRYLLKAEEVKHNPDRNFEHTEYKRYQALKGRAHTYRFETRILRTSKFVHSEAQKYLIQVNRFVLVDFVVTGFLVELHNWNVPIVTDKKLLPLELPLEGMDEFSQFNHHSLLINLDWIRRVAQQINELLGFL